MNPDDFPAPKDGFLTHFLEDPPSQLLEQLPFLSPLSCPLARWRGLAPSVRR